MEKGIFELIIKNLTDSGYEKYIDLKEVIGKVFNEISEKDFSYKKHNPAFFKKGIKINIKHYPIEEHVKEVSRYFLSSDSCEIATKLFWGRFGKLKKNKETSLHQHKLPIKQKSHKDISFIFSAFLFWYGNKLEEIPPTLFMKLLGDELAERKARKNKPRVVSFPAHNMFNLNADAETHLLKEIRDLGGMEYYKKLYE